MRDEVHRKGRRQKRKRMKEGEREKEKQPFKKREHLRKAAVPNGDTCFAKIFEI